MSTRKPAKPKTEAQALAHMVKFPPSTLFKCMHCGRTIKPVKRGNRKPIWIHQHNQSAICDTGQILKVDVAALDNAIGQLLA